MTKQPQTLIILSPGFPESEDDSTCIPIQQVFVRALKQNYPELNIIIVAFEYPFTRAQYSWYGMPVIPFGGENKNRLYRLRNWARVWRKLTKLNKKHQVVGLLSLWFDECAFVGHNFAKTHRLKHFSWMLGQDAKPGNRYFKWIKPKGESLIALSDFVARQVYKNYGVLPKNTITTGVDTSQFGPNNHQRDIDILGVGSLIPLKQYDVFIDVVKFLKEFIPNINAMICGKGPEHEKLQSLIRQHGLENNITLVGEIPHVVVLSMMQRTKVFLHTSSYEGFGVVLLEALYGGAQVVSFVKPMDADIEHHHPVNDFIAMCHKLLDIFDEPQLSYEPVLAYPIQNVASSIMELYN
jgi:glycosyltransferase involved in cell wall biosynthesis